MRWKVYPSQLRTRFLGYLALLCCVLAVWSLMGPATRVAADDAIDLGQQVISEVNARRAEAGVGAVEMSPFLPAAAQAHAEYLVANAALWSHGLDAHYQVPSYPAFYAASPADRAEKAGMTPRPHISEDVLRARYSSTSSRAAFLVDAWINAPLHRRAIIDRAMIEAGFGWATDGVSYAYVYDAASDWYAETHPGGVQEYPVDGMTDVPCGWDGNENPQPFPPDRNPGLWEGDRFTGGYPITFYATHGAFLSLSFELHCGAEIVPVVRSASYSYVFVPVDRLQPGTTYTGRMAYTMQNGFTGEVSSGVREFAFTTAGGSTTTLSTTTTLISTTTTSSTSTTLSPTTTTTRPGPASFADVGVDHPYAQAIESLATRNVISGFDEGGLRLFKPGNPVLRQQLAKMLVLGLGLTASTHDVCPFADVERSVGEELYPDHYVAVAAREGMVVGTALSPPRFSPYREVTRAQLLTMVVRAGRAPGRGTLSAPPAEWKGSLPAGDPSHGENIRWAEYNGLLAQIDLEGWDVWAPASRGEVAQVLWSLVK